MATPALPTADDVRRAAARLAGHVRRTPVMEVVDESLRAAGEPLHIKLEYVQHSGSFKARGATHFLLTQPIGDAGVVAASGGNHGGAVAWAAREAGVHATIFVPTISAPAKVDRLRSFGAEVHQVGSVYGESLQAAREFEAESGATPIHAYDDATVMAGAGTTGLEFTEQVGDLDTIVVATGGGGLAGGMACAVPGVRIVVCETFTTNAYAAAVEAGRPVDVAVSGIAADALGATSIGDRPWAALQTVDAVSAVVDDEAVVEATEALWESYRIVVEPATATAAAVLRTGAYQPSPGERVGLLLCGANRSLRDDVAARHG